ncbi:MAG: peptidoglycan/LPS O-acetylase OafA/YrhL [Gammaproteobacteria bacterium]|jgi:peptidoglycan/LPS O-acetylase OafA/YrhL
MQKIGREDEDLQGNSGPMTVPLRSDVQGLRAVAVLLVCASHFGFDPLAGGFVGVDVFFVISGYVITLSLLREYVGSSSSRLTPFYARRLSRLLPALYFVLLVSSLVAVVLLAPFEQIYNHDSLNAALAWLSNVFFQNLGGSYFDVTASGYLYIHTWSLGVEEQFYLIWPLLILLGLGRFARSPGVEGLGKVAGYILGAGLVSGFLLLVLTVAGDNSRAFYMMPARAWQFAIGAYIAVSHFRTASERQFGSGSVGYLRNLIAVAGLGLIFLAAFLFSNDVVYPGWRVLVPTLGASLLVASQWKGVDATIVGNILSTPILFRLGALSYSIYLWHWPVLYFQARIDRSVSNSESVVAFVLVILLSAGTYYCIENPLRKRLSGLSPWMVIGVLGFTTLLMFAMALGLKAAGDNGAEDLDQKKIIAARYQMASVVLYEHGCDTWHYSSALKPCLMVPNNKVNVKEVYLVGDSVAVQWFSEMGKYLVAKNWKVTILTKSACPMVDQSFYYETIKSFYTVCDEWRKNVIELISEKRPSLVVFGSAALYPFSDDQWRDGIGSVVERVSASAEKVVLLGDAGGLGFDGPLCLARESWRRRFFPEKYVASCDSVWKEPRSLRYLRAVAQSYENVKYVDFGDLICSKKCYAEKDGVITFRDSVHLTDIYVRQLSSKALERLYRLVERM